MNPDKSERPTCPCKRLPLCLSIFTSAEYGDVHSLSRRGVKQLAQRVDPLTGETPLHLAAQHGQIAATELLLRAGCHVNGSEHSKCTPLHRASFSGAVATMQLLLDETNCNLLAVDTSFNDRMTPLHKAAAGGRYLAVQLLMEHSKRRGLLDKALASTDTDGKTPLDVARDRLGHAQEAAASLARWNEVAGGAPDFDKCIKLLNGAHSVQAVQRQFHGVGPSISQPECVDCDDQTCRAASWEAAFRKALFGSTQILLGDQGSDVAAVSIPATNNQAHSPQPTAIPPDEGTTGRAPTVEPSTAGGIALGYCCDQCRITCFAVYSRNEMKVCKACRRQC